MAVVNVVNAYSETETVERGEQQTCDERVKMSFTVEHKEDVELGKYISIFDGSGINITAFENSNEVEISFSKFEGIMPNKEELISHFEAFTKILKEELS